MELKKVSKKVFSWFIVPRIFTEQMTNESSKRQRQY